ncbi:MAG: NYN domain-containing protein [Planctomycetota bacterium]|jgi:predicted RNA-binding protein with PIN domain
MPVIIDGHNLLHSVRTAGEDFESLNDVRLCHIIGRYLKRVGEKGQIVFDGTGPPDKGRFDNIAHLEVFFSGRSSDADKVIEDKIKASTAPKSLMVVSSDRRLRAAAHARRATAVKSEVFWENLRKELSRKRTRGEPPAKRSGLSEVETEQWLKFFGID